jgi:hypothetical protein
MIIAPYIHKKTIIKVPGQNDIVLHKITLLCDGGEKPWIEESDINPLIDCFEANELVIKGKLTQKNKIIFGEIDTTKTKMNLMYTYEEIEPGDELLCWRDFVVVTDPIGNPLISIPEVFREVLISLCA